MIKKQYFMMLWVLCSILPVLMAIEVIRIERMRKVGSATILATNIVPIALTVLFAVVSIIGAILFLGVTFGQKMGIRFLLLDKNIGFGRDFIKSVIFLIVLCVFAVLCGVLLGVPLASLFMYYVTILFGR